VLPVVSEMINHQLIDICVVESYHAVEPVMPLRLLRMRNGMFVAAVNFFMSCVSFSVLYFLPMWFEVVLGQSAAQSGSLLIHFARLQAMNTI
jgi:hypothetical protein